MKGDKIKIMTLSEANIIVRIWGGYIEYCQDRLQAVFGIIPESLLPYPPEMIEKALNIIAKHYHDTGDYEKSELVKETFRCLACYVKDEIAFQHAAMVFNMPDAKEAIISKMKKVQNDWIKTQE